MTSGNAISPISLEGPVFRWHKSSHSGETNSCLELRTPPQRGKTRVRDSKDLARPSLVCTTDAWAAFLDAIRAEQLK
ncbi:DUF397 domain-containing protein [Streptomyces sp. NPDC002643]